MELNMPRPKRDYEVRRVRLDGFVPVGVSAEDDALLAWLDNLPSRKKFPIVWAMLKAGGAAIQRGEVVLSDLDEAEAMAEEFFNAFVA